MLLCLCSIWYSLHLQLLFNVGNKLYHILEWCVNSDSIFPFVLSPTLPESRDIYIWGKDKVHQVYINLLSSEVSLFYASIIFVVNGPMNGPNIGGGKFNAGLNSSLSVRLEGYSLRSFKNLWFSSSSEFYLNILNHFVRSVNKENLKNLIIVLLQTWYHICARWQLPQSK